MRLESATDTVNALAGAVVCDSGSLKVRMTWVPSMEVAALDRVGRTPSTVWALSAATAVWSRTASMVVEPAFRIVPPFRVSLFAPTAIPSASSRLSATVQANTRAVVPEPLS